MEGSEGWEDVYDGGPVGACSGGVFSRLTGCLAPELEFKGSSVSIASGTLVVGWR